jgi:predicted nucleic acid-binding Zn ribbon protein
MTMEEKTCLNCGQPVGPGRKDKKYCSEACKTEYNNRQKEHKQATAARSLPEYIQAINSVLIKNRRILDDCLVGENKKRMEKRDLDGRGFNFKFITSQAPTNEDEGYCFCYEVGYKVVDHKWVIIIRREREVICGA